MIDHLVKIVILVKASKEELSELQMNNLNLKREKTTSQKIQASFLEVPKTVTSKRSKSLQKTDQSLNLINPDQVLEFPEMIKLHQPHNQQLEEVWQEIQKQLEDLQETFLLTVQTKDKANLLKNQHLQERIRNRIKQLQQDSLSSQKNLKRRKRKTLMDSQLSKSECEIVVVVSL